MKNRSSGYLEAVIFLLVLLLVYTAVSKLLNFDHFKVQMRIQTLPFWLSGILVYTLPPIELAAAVLLLMRRTKLYGLFLSLALMTVFTGYVALVLLNFFGRIPCSCGGVLQHLGWGPHFFLNIFYLLLTASGIYVIYRERRTSRQA